MTPKFHASLSLFLLLFLVLGCFGCHRSPWQHSSIRNSNRHHDLAKLTYPSSSPNGGIELELNRHGNQVSGYIHVKEYALPFHDQNPHETFLVISTSEASQNFTIPLMEGGQRATLSKGCLDYLLQTLQLKSIVTLSSGHFSQEIDASNFKAHYDALLKEPSKIFPESFIHFELY